MSNKTKKINVFSVPWHVAHQYELLKLPFNWHYLIQHTRKWDNRNRPMPKDLKWVPYFEEGKYDLAILHVDQQCLLESLGKSKLFKHLIGVLKGKLPIIVINHGTPIYPELFNQMAADEEGLDPTDENGIAWGKKKMKELLKDVDAVVVNSHKAQEQWGDYTQAIIHGLDKDEWWDLRKEPRTATCISPAGIGDKYYNRGLFRETREILRDKYGIEIVWISQDFIGGSWDEYREFLGKTLIYFNPTYGSPMPRTRTEAMFSGCCVITTKYQDADTFIEDGVNGIICKNNPLDAAKKIADMTFNYPKAIEIGQKGKETAQKLFSGERFREDWIKLVNKVLKSYENKK